MSMFSVHAIHFTLHCFQVSPFSLNLAFPSHFQSGHFSIIITFYAHRIVLLVECCVNLKMSSISNVTFSADLNF